MARLATFEEQRKQEEFNQKVSFHVLPNRSGFVVADIVELSKSELVSNRVILTKSFGSLFRKPIEKDYIEARAWTTQQLNYIYQANR